jgi:predicted nucleotide-binding protein
MTKKKAITQGKKTKQNNVKKSKRSMVSQTDIPKYTLEQSIRIPTAIFDNYAGDPTSPLKLAAALDMSPTSGPFRMLTGAAIAYGLISGGAQATSIELTPLAKRIIAPVEDGDDLVAKREAILKPRIIGEFLRKYDNKPIPTDAIAYNVLVEIGAHRDKAKETFDLIVSTAETLGLIRNIKDKRYIDLSGITAVKPVSQEEELTDEEDASVEELDEITSKTVSEQAKTEELKADMTRKKRVFITHGKNMAFVETIKKLLSFGELEAVVSVDKQSVSKPVPDKVMDDMRSCGAAIIHVDAEDKLMGTDAKERLVLNSNVLIEIGAAMALYKHRFILLVKDGVTLPSNLQGLYEVRYSGSNLDGDITIKLLEAINAMKKA